MDLNKDVAYLIMKTYNLLILDNIRRYLLPYSNCVKGRIPNIIIGKVEKPYDLVCYGKYCTKTSKNNEILQIKSSQWCGLHMIFCKECYYNIGMKPFADYND